MVFVWLHIHGSIFASSSLALAGLSVALLRGWLLLTYCRTFHQSSFIFWRYLKLLCPSETTLEAISFYLLHPQLPGQPSWCFLRHHPLYQINDLSLQQISYYGSKGWISKESKKTPQNICKILCKHTIFFFNLLLLISKVFLTWSQFPLPPLLLVLPNIPSPHHSLLLSLQKCTSLPGISVSHGKLQ